ncbi:MAG: imidazoleglycerol-phosphate dehydratase HisB [Bacteroidia bacterium]|nr:imidazoleglycerol-phosphate dehydratase HisB [Bacteroidia bacterium]
MSDLSIPLTPTVHRYLFIDRDGTLIEEPADTQQVDSCERLRLLPRVLSVLRWAQEVGGYRLVLITNQDGLGTEAFPEQKFWIIQRLLMDLCASEGVIWYGLHIDRSRNDSPSPYRKPSPIFLLPYVEAGLDIERSFVIGDRRTDMLLAQRLGLRGLWLPNPLHPRDTSLPGAIWVENWQDVLEALKRAVFSTHVVRQTNETNLSVRLTLYGEGRVRVHTGIGFLDHMLTLMAFHAGWDMELVAEGDLHVDAHHTMEDVAIGLGRALYRLLQDKRGLHRYGQDVKGSWRLVPMDEALALVAMDLSGRGLLVWRVALSEAPGGLSVSLWKHFFETLAREAALTLHIQAHGEDAHHTIESIFKGVGRALREALQREAAERILPSTKGTL